MCHDAQGSQGKCSTAILLVSVNSSFEKIVFSLVLVTTYKGALHWVSKYFCETPSERDMH
jgi:hypothetical protein